MFISVLHNKKNLQKYLEQLNKVFSPIKRIENGENINNFLSHPVSYNPYI